MSNTVSLILVGVGGQGIVKASEIIGLAAQKAEYDVKVSEVHGMSQRGGSVETYIRYGEKVHSPLVEKGKADLIVAFEQLEALRWIKYLKPNGTMIINNQIIEPITVVSGNEKYPKNIIRKIKDKCKNTISVDVLNIAKECGNVKTANIVLIGIIAVLFNINKSIWLECIKEVLPQKVLDVNLRAFEFGYSYGKQIFGNLKAKEYVAATIAN